MMPEMSLFEATNGAEGNSYVRLYVWAASIERAEELAAKQFDSRNFEVTELFKASEEEFVTKPSSDGFER